MNLIETLEREAIDALTADKQIPEFRPGDTLRVGVKVIEGDRTRVQAFEGVCIARANKGVGSSFTVRKISFGEGVERVFPLYSPIIDAIEVVRRGDVRRAKLYYLRGRTGKAARIAERRDVRRDVPGGKGAETRRPRRERSGSLSFTTSSCRTRRSRYEAACVSLAAAAIAASRRRRSATRSSPEEADDRADLREPADLRRRRRACSSFRPTGDTRRCCKPRAEDRERFDLWAMDTATGQLRMLVDSTKIGGGEISEAEKMRRERARVGGSKGIVEYEWAPDGKSVLAPVDGDLYLADVASGAVRRLTNTPQTEIDAHVSEGGRYVSFVRDQNLYAIDLATGTERAADHRRQGHRHLRHRRVRRSGGNGPPHRHLVGARRQPRRGRML